MKLRPGGKTAGAHFGLVGVPQEQDILGLGVQKEGGGISEGGPGGLV